MAGKIVVVTGANGYLALVLVKHLLERGYTVRGTVRNPSDVAKVGPLLELPGAEERLQLYKADLLGEGAYDDAVDGAEGVFHSAAAVLINSTDPWADIVDPALKGTLNVLKSAAKSKSVKRVVYTSSFVAAMVNSRPRDSNTLVDESWWSDVEFCKQNQKWYPLARTLAEQAAWDFAKDSPFDLVAILPSVVVGGANHSSMDYCRTLLLRSLRGEKTEYSSLLDSSWVDVNDVALAHILAFEIPSAEGRYDCVGQTMHIKDIDVLLKKLFPKYAVQVPELGKDQHAPGVPSYRVNTGKLQKLGVNFRPLEESFKTHVECLEKRGLLKGVAD